MLNSLQRSFFSSVKSVSNWVPFDFLDILVSLGTSLKLKPFRIFPKGWGASLKELNKLYEINLPLPNPTIKVEWIKNKTDGPLPYREGLFIEPQTEGLPKSIRKARFRFISPPQAKGKVCLLLAGWGEHGYGSRRELAQSLLEKGIGSLMLESAYHGKRKIPGRQGNPIETVAEFGLLGRSTVLEARSLLSHFRKLGFRVGIAGYSMGGYLGGVAAVTLPYPLPTTLLAVPYSPEIPFLEGSFKKGIRWPALANQANPEKKLHRLFAYSSLLKLNAPHAKSKTMILGSRSDRFVESSYLKKLHEHWPDAQLRWYSRGHLGLWLFETKAISENIAECFED